MHKAAVETKLLAVVSSILGVPHASLSLGSSRDTVTEWDSLKHMHLMLGLEDEFRIEFTDQEIGTLTSVSSLRDAIMSKTGGDGMRQ